MYFGAAFTTLVITAVALFTMFVAPEWRSCTGDPDIDRDTQIGSCTALIQSSQETAHNRAVAYTNRGNAWYAKDDNNGAIADYNDAIRLDPKLAMAYYNRGNTYAAKGDKDRAIADFSEAIRLDPKYAAAFELRGNVYRGKGDNDRALADYNEAIRLDPELAWAFNNRGKLFFYNGDFEKAAADLLRVNDLNDDAYAMLWRYLALGGRTAQPNCPPMRHG